MTQKVDDHFHLCTQSLPITTTGGIHQ